MTTTRSKRPALPLQAAGPDTLAQAAAVPGSASRPGPQPGAVAGAGTGAISGAFVGGPGSALASPGTGQPAQPSASQATIALLQAHSLTSVVQTEIERLILSGELAPGAKLTEAMLADRLGVSRGPIREAFRMLEEAGLVRLEKNRGVFVRSIAMDEAMEIYDLRAMIDESVGRQLAAHITTEQLQLLRGLVEQMERLVKDGHNTSASDPYHRLNLAFHDRLVEFAGNRKVITLYRRLVNELSLFRRLNLADGGQIPVSVAEHRAILKAIAAGDAEAAGQALRAHVQESKERTLRNQQPGWAPAPVPAPVPAPAPTPTQPPKSTPAPATTAAPPHPPPARSRTKHV